MFLWWASTTLHLLCTTTQGALPCAAARKNVRKSKRATLLKRLEDHGSWVPKIAIEPELAVRIRPAQHQLSVLLHAMLLSQRTMPSLRQRPRLRTQQEPGAIIR